MESTTTPTKAHLEKLKAEENKEKKYQEW